MLKRKFSLFLYDSSVRYDAVVVPLSNVEESITRAFVGYEVARRLQVPILILTGDANRETPDTALYHAKIRELDKGRMVFVIESESRSTKESFRNVRDRYFQHLGVHNPLFVGPNYMCPNFKHLAKTELPDYDVGVLGFDPKLPFARTVVNHLHQKLLRILPVERLPKRLIQIYKISEKRVQNNPQELMRLARKYSTTPEFYEY